MKISALFIGGVADGCIESVDEYLKTYRKLKPSQTPSMESFNEVPNKTATLEFDQYIQREINVDGATFYFLCFRQNGL